MENQETQNIQRVNDIERYNEIFGAQFRPKSPLDSADAIKEFIKSVVGQVRFFGGLVGIDDWSDFSEMLHRENAEESPFIKTNTFWDIMECIVFKHVTGGRCGAFLVVCLDAIIDLAFLSVIGKAMPVFPAMDYSTRAGYINRQFGSIEGSLTLKIRDEHVRSKLEKVIERITHFVTNGTRPIHVSLSTMNGQESRLVMMSVVPGCYWLEPDGIFESLE